MPDALPTFADLSPTKGVNLDEKLALKNFLGKTLNEAESLFRENAIYYQESLMWMGDKGFCFYFRAYDSYLRSVHANGDCDALNCLNGLISFRVEHQPHSILQTKECILSLVNYCVEHFSKFEVNPDIYGDLGSKLVQLQSRVRELNPPDP
jgi:hypothetical protein